MNSGSIEYLKAAMAKQKQSFEEERKAMRLEMEAQRDEYVVVVVSSSLLLLSHAEGTSRTHTDAHTHSQKE